MMDVWILWIDGMRRERERERERMIMIMAHDYGLCECE